MFRFGRSGTTLVLSALLAPSACTAEGAPLRPSASSTARRVVYLDFADGSSGVSLSDDDDATSDVSRLCDAPAFARWTAPPECAGGERDACRAEVARLVASYFEPYDVDFTLSRPTSGDFSTLIVAPPHPACSFGKRGAAFADCGDENPTSVGFAFDCYADAASCAVLIAHEVAHGFGLVHTTDEADIMRPAPDDPALRFRAEEAVTDDDTCDVGTQSSHAALLAVLGPRR